MLDFVHQYNGHTMKFSYGSALAAHFIGESGLVRFKDHVLLRNTSGKVGIWHLYSVIYHQPGRFKAVGRLVGYQENYDIEKRRQGSSAGVHALVTSHSGVSPVAFGTVAEPLPESEAPTTPMVDYIDRRG